MIGRGEGQLKQRQKIFGLPKDYFSMVYSIYGGREYKRQEASVHVMALPEAYIIHYIYYIMLPHRLIYILTKYKKE